MEPNQNTQPVQSTPEQSVIPVATPDPTGVVNSGGNYNKIWVILVIIAVIVVLAAAGYVYMNRESLFPSAQPTPSPAKTTTNSTSDLDAELNSVNPEDPAIDFVEMDKDIQSL